MQKLTVEVTRRVWGAWRRFGQWLGDIMARVVLTILYFTVVLPFGVGVRLLADPLRLKRAAGESYWHRRPPLDETLVEAGRQ